MKAPAPLGARPLAGLVLLVVEDEYLLAMEMAELLAAAGAEVVGPLGKLEPAREVSWRRTLDGAILDIKLDGHTTLSLIDELVGQGIPVVLASGIDPALLPPDYHDLPYVAKPIDPRTLLETATRAFRRK